MSNSLRTFSARSFGPLSSTSRLSRTLILVHRHAACRSAALGVPGLDPRSRFSLSPLRLFILLPLLPVAVAVLRTSVPVPLFLFLIASIVTRVPVLALVFVIPVVVPRAAAASVALAVRVPIAFVTAIAVSVLLAFAAFLVTFPSRFLALSARRRAAVI